MVYGGDPPQYEVEFPDSQGGNLGSSPTYTITEAYMLPVLRDGRSEEPPS